MDMAPLLRPVLEETAFRMSSGDEDLDGEQEGEVEFRFFLTCARERLTDTAEALQCMNDYTEGMRNEVVPAASRATSSAWAGEREGTLEGAASRARWVL